MAKGQKRSNREAKKPKAAKAPMETMQVSGLATQSALDRIVPGKKKR